MPFSLSLSLNKTHTTHRFILTFYFLDFISLSKTHAKSASVYHTPTHTCDTHSSHLHTQTHNISYTRTTQNRFPHTHTHPPTHPHTHTRTHTHTHTRSNSFLRFFALNDVCAFFHPRISMK